MSLKAVKLPYKAEHLSFLHKHLKGWPWIREESQTEESSQDSVKPKVIGFAAKYCQETYVFFNWKITLAIRQNTNAVSIARLVSSLLYPITLLPLTLSFLEGLSTSILRLLAIGIGYLAQWEFNQD